MAVMLDGRPDIADCLTERGSALAIVPDGDPVTALPEFSHLKGKKDMWGQSYDGTWSPGLGEGGDLVSSSPEQRLIGDPGYPPDRDTS